uniref:Uncharacterized protein n=1 Tax=Arundo donax TaxID=35708 RepID=A0A0A9B886_ARUDO
MSPAPAPRNAGGSPSRPAQPPAAPEFELNWHAPASPTPSHWSCPKHAPRKASSMSNRAHPT